MSIKYIPKMMPCPFCGEKPELVEWFTGARVVCTECGATGGTAEFQGVLDNAVQAWIKWETRIQPHAEETNISENYCEAATSKEPAS